MGRSNTFPATESRNNSQSSNTPIGRSATASPQNAHRYNKGPLLSRRQDAPDPAITTNAPQRNGPIRQNSVQTRYMDMLLAMDTIPRLHNILASFFLWLLLAGFLIFPGTFTTIKTLDNEAGIQNNQTASTILATVKNIPLLVIAGACAGIAALGMVWLWWRWRHNYVWLLNKIFLPGCLNSFAGLISTLISVYTQQNSIWSITAKVTAIVTGASMVVNGVLFVLYNFWVLGKVRRSHTREMESTAGNHDETLIEKVERKVLEPGLEPGSVV